MGKRVAIVGSGCAGLSALWALRTSTDHDIHLFESAPRLGGQTNTMTYKNPHGETIEVDTGFNVMNTETYSNIIAVLKELGVPTENTEMTFGVSRDQGSFEWANRSLSSIFAQRRNILNPGMWRLLFDIIRFNEFALDLLQDPPERGDRGHVVNERQSKGRTSCQESIGDYLDREAFSQEFRDDYLIPIMTAANWNINPDICSLEFPAITLIRFMYSHHLLSTFANRPDWLTVPGGMKQYVDAVLKDFPKDKIHLECKVNAIAPTETGAVKLTANGQYQEFDHVILATHADQALEILRLVASHEETRILGGFHSSRNVAVLHSDVSLMPKRRLAWSACNCITESPFPPKKTQNVSQVCLTYWMNSIQRIPENVFGPVLVTLNPLTIPNPLLAQGIWEYSRPQYSAVAIESQQLLPRIQNTRNISFCGAWTRYGLHDDGVDSGLAVAVHHLKARLPFEFIDSSLPRGMKPSLTLKNHLLRLVLLIVHIAILLAGLAWTKLTTTLPRQIALKRKIA